MKAIIGKIRALVTPAPAAPASEHDPVWTLARKKQQAERMLRAEGFSRSEACTIASKMIRKGEAS